MIANLVQSREETAIQNAHVPTVLIAEDDANMRELIVDVLAPLNARIMAADSASDALGYLEDNEVAVVVTDLRMPGVDGIGVLRFAKGRDPLTQVVLITGYATVESAVDALKSGAFDYVRKPFETVELRCTVERALEHYLLSCENRRLREQNREWGKGDFLIGQSREMAKVKRLIDAAAAYDCSVLIYGHSGCGKELIARQIHQQSARRDKSFVAINCAAIPENLIESELFGYAKGAFTGAGHSKPGLFEMADGGTIFLDEINNSTPSLQAKLLRVLQDGTFYRMGETEPRNVDVRVLAATNEPVIKLIEEGRFREDLYYRLKVIEIEVPPLSQRREDLPLLVNYFVHNFSKQLDKEIKGITTEVLGAFMRYHWPGNVRELENLIQRMIILAEGDKLTTDLLPPEIAHSKERTGCALDYLPPQSLDDVEAFFIKKTLRMTKGDRALTAEILGIDKSTLWRKIKRYQLSE